MNSLVLHLPELARERGSLTAVRDRGAGAWRFLSWDELGGEVNRVAGALGAQRGVHVAWSAARGVPRLVLELALLHLGAVGVWDVGAKISDERFETLRSAPPELGRLVRLGAELRPRDPALVRAGRIVDHGAVEASGRRVAEFVGLGANDLVLVTASVDAEQVLGWGALHGGFGLMVAAPSTLGAIAPTAWLCTPDQIDALELPRSRAGVFRGILKGLGGLSDGTGGRLAKVWVEGVVPASAERLRERGVEVAVWRV